MAPRIINYDTEISTIQYSGDKSHENILVLVDGTALFLNLNFSSLIFRITCNLFYKLTRVVGSHRTVVRGGISLDPGGGMTVVASRCSSISHRVPS